jgi:uncharacterized protein (TIGR03067 family)
MLLFVGVGLVSFLPAEQAALDDKAKLQGLWQVTAAEAQGEKLAAEAASGVRFVFDGDKLLINQGDEGKKTAVFKLNAAAKPKTIDLVEEEGKKTVQGIYEFDGDTLKLCLAEAGSGAARPTVFATKAGTRHALFVLKRDLGAISDEDKSGAEILRRLKEGGARRQSVINLKSMGIAMHNYHNDFGHFPPPAIYSKDGKPLLSWRVTILPYLQHDSLYKQFHLDEPWDSAHNKALLPLIPSYFVIPNVTTKEKHSTFYRVFVSAKDAKPSAMFNENEKITLGQITVQDGASNTFMIVEAGDPVPWTKPNELIYAGDKPLPKLGGAFRDGFHACFSDAAVRFIAKEIYADEPVLRALITRNGGEAVNASRYFK